MLLDLLVGIFVMGIVMNHIQREFSLPRYGAPRGIQGLTDAATRLILLPLLAALVAS